MQSLNAVFPISPQSIRVWPTGSERLTASKEGGNQTNNKPAYKTKERNRQKQDSSAFGAWRRISIRLSIMYYYINERNLKSHVEIVPSPESVLGNQNQRATQYNTGTLSPTSVASISSSLGPFGNGMVFVIFCIVLELCLHFFLRVLRIRSWACFIPGTTFIIGGTGGALLVTVD